MATRSRSRSRSPARHKDSHRDHGDRDRHKHKKHKEKDKKDHKNKERDYERDHDRASAKRTNVSDDSDSSESEGEGLVTDRYRRNDDAEAKKKRKEAKREEKKKKRLAEMGWDEEQLAYTNDNNPFGDPNLHEQFVWKKKQDKDLKTGISRSEQELRERQRREENRKELEKVKRRRQEREEQMALMEEERNLMQRENDKLTYSEWREKEEHFELEQLKKRSHIRVLDGRAKPVDVLVRCVEGENDLTEVELVEPHLIFFGLSLADCEELARDVQIYLDLDLPDRRPFWVDIQTICQDEINKRLELAASQHGRDATHAGAINPQVRLEIQTILAAKTTSQLRELRSQILAKIDHGQAGNVSYWESLLQQLDVKLAVSRLRDRHEHVLRLKLKELKEKASSGNESHIEAVLRALETNARQRLEDETVAKTGGKSTDEQSKQESGAEATTTTTTTNAVGGDDVVFTEEDLYHTDQQEEEASADYELPLIEFKNIDPVVLKEAADPAADLERLRILRSMVVGGQRRLDPKRADLEGQSLSEAEHRFMEEAQYDMDEEEAVFSSAVALPFQPQGWHEKYRPRKPRFFNRVHTGFEWNQYNRTHYDRENPPPKVIQGYKFNLFYGDLIDKSKAPTYTITPDPADKTMATIRFSAGAPYEDIAFRIVNRDWEYSHKNGFRCEFKGGVFYLWFRYRRERYRR